MTWSMVARTGNIDTATDVEKTRGLGGGRRFSNGLPRRESVRVKSRSLGIRASEVVKASRTQGLRTVGARLVRRAYQQSGAASLEFPLLSGDIADSTRLDLSVPTSAPPRSHPLTVGWICTPPSAGSGGHTTMFRMVSALEQAGHTCVLYLYDRFGGSLERHSEVIRSGWPHVRAQVRDVASELGDLDACVATSWQTAHVLASRPATVTRRCYFIQDFEPFFYPRGSEYELAADTYRFGFRNIALGEMVASQLRFELGVPCSVVPFSCDTDVYSLTNPGHRSGVVFYAKPDVARRGYLLGKLALEQFHDTFPDQVIHVYGERVRDFTIPFVQHEKLSPTELSLLYNRSIAGLAMSFTNISLVAEEMLACGTIPVVNDSPLSRADMPNDSVAWAKPTPGSIADVLCRLMEHRDVSGRAVSAAAAVRSDSWSATGAAVVRVIEEEVYATNEARVV